jgi:hypothetical protein
MRSRHLFNIKEVVALAVIQSLYATIFVLLARLPLPVIFIHGETVDETLNLYKLLKGLSLLESILLTSRLWSCAHEIKIAE